MLKQIDKLALWWCKRRGHWSVSSGSTLVIPAGTVCDSIHVYGGKMVLGTEPAQTIKTLSVLAGGVGTYTPGGSIITTFHPGTAPIQPESSRPVETLPSP
jgi:hypothetical protein